jgi:hypothetical protein
MITRGWGEPVAKSQLFRLGVANPIHLSGKAVMSATGRLPTFPGKPIRIPAVSIRITDGSHFAFGGKVSDRPEPHIETPSHEPPCSHETFIRYAVVRKDRCVRSSGFLLTSATAVSVKHRKHRFFKALFA